jgi:hypothetical protein
MTVDNNFLDTRGPEIWDMRDTKVYLLLFLADSGTGAAGANWSSRKVGSVTEAERKEATTGFVVGRICGSDCFVLCLRREAALSSAFLHGEHVEINRFEISSCGRNWWDSAQETPIRRKQFLLLPGFEHQVLRSRCCPCKVPHA